MRFLLALLMFAPLTALAQETQEPRVLEQIAKVAIERVLSKTLDAPVTVGSVQMDGKSEFLELKDFAIGNPKGFKSSNAISVGTVRVEATPRLLFSKEPDIRLISVSEPTVNVETGLQGSNLLTLMRNARKAQGLPSKPGPMAKEMKWKIEKGILEKAQVNMTTELLQQSTKTKKIDKMEMSFMGSDGQGVTAQEGMQQFLKQLMDKLGIADDMQGGGVGGLIGGILGR